MTNASPDTALDASVRFGLYFLLPGMILFFIFWVVHPASFHQQGFAYLKFLRQTAFFHERWLFGYEALIQKEILNTDILNAIFIPPRFHIVFHHDDFLEGIRDSDQGSNLLFLLIRIING